MSGEPHPQALEQNIYSMLFRFACLHDVHCGLQGEVQQQHMRQQQAVQAAPTVPDRSLTPVQVRTLGWGPS